MEAAGARPPLDTPPPGLGRLDLSSSVTIVSWPVESTIPRVQAARSGHRRLLRHRPPCIPRLRRCSVEREKERRESSTVPSFSLFCK